jgi:hypothetical protein
MRNRIAVLSAVAAGATLMLVTQSSATPLGAAVGAVSQTSLSDEVSNVIEVQAGRRGGRGGGGGALRGGRGGGGAVAGGGRRGGGGVAAAGGRRGGGGGFRRGGGGRGIATGLAIGTAVGIVGGMIEAEQEVQANEAASAVDYCVRRFRSYDPSTGFYIGRDGRPHRCP